ncbi:hypothetical protein CNR22_12620 [Sphingobacteriaceae bacterium]|nr:hypothetical protein CNR22_12620 [Sphingobacteriaceae bacterium]
MYLKFLLLSVLSCLFSNTCFSQVLSNGDFSSGTSGWACGVEVNTESTYGGSSSNAVVEVDAGAGLCQTITGLTIGNAYLVSFSSSRRTGGCPSPSVTNIDVNVSGGALSTTITRTNTTFGFTSDYFLFTANSATHTLTFSAGSGFGGSTCGMIMDNFVVTFSPLPIELLHFDAYYSEGQVDFTWSTASEKNNSHFIIEKSPNGSDFSDVQQIPTKASNGNSATKLHYTSTDLNPLTGVSYYRLKQVDFDGAFSNGKIISIGAPLTKEKALYPNPNAGAFSIAAKISGKISISIYTTLQELVHSETQFISSEAENVKIDLQDKLAPGYYHCLVSTHSTAHNFPLIIR